MSLKVYLAPILAAVVVIVVACTQSNQAAHLSGAQYVNAQNGEVPVYQPFARTKAGNTVYRIVDCESLSLIYVNGSGGISTVVMEHNSVIDKHCGGK